MFCRLKHDCSEGSGAPFHLRQGTVYVLQCLPQSLSHVCDSRADEDCMFWCIFVCSTVWEGRCYPFPYPMKIAFKASMAAQGHAAMEGWVGLAR
ncbi:hypothetical protein PGB90_004165 [Kerria lacca]